MRWRLVIVAALLAISAWAQEPAPLQEMTLTVNTDMGFGKSVTVLLVLTALSLVPSIIMMMTSFTRIVIVLMFFRQAMGIQQALPARVITSLSLFLTLFIMEPVWSRIYTEAVLPCSREEISQQEALGRGTDSVKAFMLGNTRESSLLLFMELSNMEPVGTPQELPMRIIIPAFMLSELKTAFQMAFLIYLPFLAIDMIVATVLMAMGMMMLPPVMISLPFKLLLFIMVGGWELLVRVLVTSFM